MKKEQKVIYDYISMFNKNHVEATLVKKDDKK